MGLIIGTLLGLFLASRADAAPRFGLNDDLAAWEGHAGTAQLVGADTARIPVGYNVNPNSIRPLVDDLRARGIRPLFLVWGIRPAPDAFAEGAAAWASAYPDALIQLLNEPNHHAFSDIGPVQAARIVTAGAHAIREASPNTTVIGPGLAPEVIDGRASSGWRNYFNALYSELPRRVAVGLHIFPYSKTPMRTVGDFYKRAAKRGPVYVTELGFFANSYGSMQPAWSARGYRKLSRLGAKAIIFHRLAPLPDPSPWERAARMGLAGNDALTQALRTARANDLKGPR